jgi:hypothetical protein
LALSLALTITLTIILYLPQKRSGLGSIGCPRRVQAKAAGLYDKAGLDVELKPGDQT